MKESSFVEQNKKKWSDFEKAVAEKKKDPDKLSNLFIEITDDLSYSQTFYSNRMVRLYLNGVAQRVSNTLHKSRKFTLKKFFYFWKEELPQMVYEARKEFLLSFLIFAISFLIGVFSSANNPEFPRIILGDNYVDMTIENIEKGDPMSVYKQQNEIDMTLSITVNNLRVAFLTFVCGALFAGGTVIVLIFNGIMVGAFQYFFYDRGVFIESFLTIWQHGTLEISAIIIAGAAGLVLGRGLVIPETLSRLQAFQLSARRGIKIMIGITPIIIFAGIIESFITRHTEANVVLRILVILSSLTLILGYFVWYPIMKKRKGFKTKLKQRKLPPSLPQTIDYTTVKSSAEIFTDSFILFKRYLQPIFYIALALAVLYSVFAYYMSDLFTINYNIAWTKPTFIFQLFRYNEGWKLFAVNTLVFSTIALLMFYLVQRDEKEKMPVSTKNIWQALPHFLRKALVPILILTAISNSLFYAHIAIQIILILFVLPIVIMWMFVLCKERLGALNALVKTFELMQKTYSNLLTLNITFLLLILFLYLFFQAPIFGFYISFIEMNVLLEGEVLRVFYIVFLSFVSILGLCLIIPLFFISFALYYYSLIEINEAKHLREEVKRIGIQKATKY